MKSLGWGTFLLWGVFDAVIAIVTFFFLKETRGLSLETIAHSKFKKGTCTQDFLGKDTEIEEHEGRTK